MSKALELLGASKENVFDAQGWHKGLYVEYNTAVEAVKQANPEIPDLSDMYKELRELREAANGLTVESSRIKYQSKMDLLVALQTLGIITLKSI